ncbi:MAG: hypothetical protein A3E87_07765 [Gammaproteobacteria bacterium RIFCSPHIGHO2_12_FULL_35_23]|nr:MAG: hypothetical protein A3E87_07765 [Gammaproteobacteria bacterium RIFCSPHIGHO2_12_FULL_35_23]
MLKLDTHVEHLYKAISEMESRLKELNSSEHYTAPETIHIIGTLGLAIENHHKRIQALLKIKASDPITTKEKELLMQMPIFRGEHIIVAYDNIHDMALPLACSGTK